MSQAQRNYQTTLAADLQNLQVLRDFIETACSECGIDQEDCFALQLSADEACTNIILHGYDGLPPGSIRLELEILPAQATLRIIDTARPFDPRTSQPPDLEASLEDRRIGGLGIFFIFNTMDSVDYHSDGNGNTLTLTRKLGGGR